MIRAGDIYLIPGMRIGKCVDSRPCLVLAVFSNSAYICLLSSQFDMTQGHEITLLKSDPEFAESGLTKDSFILEFSGHDLALSTFEKAHYLGRAIGNFKK